MGEWGVFVSTEGALTAWLSSYCAREMSDMR
jgi:hypothetical protein